jgi:hypothetical protein
MYELVDFGNIDFIINTVPVKNDLMSGWSEPTPGVSP